MRSPHEQCCPAIQISLAMDVSELCLPQCSAKGSARLTTSGQIPSCTTTCFNVVQRCPLFLCMLLKGGEVFVKNAVDLNRQCVALKPGLVVYRRL